MMCCKDWQKTDYQDLYLNTRKVNEVQEFCYVGSHKIKDGISKNDTKC